MCQNLDGVLDDAHNIHRHCVRSRRLLAHADGAVLLRVAAVRLPLMHTRAMKSPVEVIRLCMTGCVALFTESSGVFLSHVLQFLPWMLFLAVSEGLAFMLMALGQNYSPPTHAAIILSLGDIARPVVHIHTCRL